MFVNKCDIETPSNTAWS